MKLACTIVLGAALVIRPAFAAPTQDGAMAPLPAEKIAGQVRYVTGGVGQEEAEAFRQAQRDYSLALEFGNQAKPRAQFTAGVNVLIRDARGNTVLDAVSDGPFLLAKLPAGRYTIRATQNGKTLDRVATVAGGKSTHVAFLWQDE
ncbi:MAG TPA: carboxypeptidase regulatory-like domain-containing protein [Burkholderiales bacterium]|jgi:hypothetical protein|nr:carboxypeptidase regulatory-like domain-containing protein [Burkholderiales bacterium]